MAFIDWPYWDAVIAHNGVVIDRPRGSRHPEHADVVYPLAFGHVPYTIGGDGKQIDVFVGSGRGGLVGAIETFDRRKGIKELTLLWNATEWETELAQALLNSGRMSAVLVRRVDRTQG